MTLPDHALLTPAEMAQADAAAPLHGRSVDALMQAAGLAVAQAIRQRFRPCRVLVLAGPGNNGGDGFVAARLLEQAGWPVSVAAWGRPRPGSVAAEAASRWRGPVVPLSSVELARAGLVVDALFGAGLTRPLEAPLVHALRGLRAKLVAVDLPSGLDGATGQVLGGESGFAPQAALSVTFFRRKPGHLLLPGRALCGEVVLAPIGMPEAVLARIAPRAFHNGPALWPLPVRRAESHKFTQGHVTIPAGPALSGAARLAAGAARRGGAGLVSLVAPDRATALLLRTGEPGLMVAEEGVETLLADRRRHTWLVGPGLPAAEPTLALLRRLLRAGRQVVADGGALTAAEGNPEALRGCAVLTPHAGEFARVFGAPGVDRIAAVRAAAARCDSVTILKGADSIIAAPDGRVVLNDHAPPALAMAGSGDVLAGLVAALLAQGMAPFEAACAAVWVHGEAAYRALRGAPAGAPLLPEAVLEEIGGAIAAQLPG